MQIVVEPGLVEEVCKARLQEREHSRLVGTAQASQQVRADHWRAHLEPMLVAAKLRFRTGRWMFTAH